MHISPSFSNLEALGQAIYLLQQSSEREKAALKLQYQALFQEMLADLRIKMAAPKSGRT